MIARDVPRVARVLSRVAGTHQRIPYMVLRARHEPATDRHRQVSGRNREAFPDNPTRVRRCTGIIRYLIRLVLNLVKIVYFAAVFY